MEHGKQTHAKTHSKQTNATQMKGARWNRAANLAFEALDECRVQLMLKFRFLDMALWRMNLEPTHVQTKYALATDATKVYFEPFMVLGRFQESFDELIRDYLHVVMHCIFRHPFDIAHKKNIAWWLATDVIAESVAMDICGTRFVSEHDAQRKQILTNLKAVHGNLTPSKLYRIFDEALSSPEGAQGITTQMLIEIERLFARDDHNAWPAFAKQEQTDDKGEAKEVSESFANEALDDDNDISDGEPEKNSSEHTDGQKQSSQEDPQKNFETKIGSNDSGDDTDSNANSIVTSADVMDDAGGDTSGTDGADDYAKTNDAKHDASNSKDAANMSDADSFADSSNASGVGNSDIADGDADSPDDVNEQAWRDISEQISMDLQTFSKNWGDEAASFIQNINVVNRKTTNYADFLNRFAVLTEDISISADEFDYISYELGMAINGNIPFIEPLEYTEKRLVRDFVVAIDTSGSTEGQLVKKFVQRTFEILKNTESFGTNVNIHVVQCDAKVQSDTKIANVHDVDTFLKDFYVRGMGGTDFRPVFDYIEKLQDAGELTSLQGMIYFTDGLGFFPTDAPSYDVAFVFVDDGAGETPQVPPWAMKIILADEQFA